MPTTEKEQQDAALYAARREHFNDVLDARECRAGDWTVRCTAPAPTREETMRALPTERLATDGPQEKLAKIGRWALVTRSTRGHGQFVTNVADEVELERAAGENLGEGWTPLCYHDLDRLAGEEPTPEEGDEVDAGHGTVTVTELDFKDSDPTVTMSDGKWAFASEVRIVQRIVSQDRRLPVRYEVAKVLTSVVFNTVPTGPGD